jgi:hypothetical protein
MQALNSIPQDAFQQCYKRWQHRWKMCVQVQEKYIEGDHILIDEKVKFFFWNQSHYFIGRPHKCWLFEQCHCIVLFVESWYE